MARSPSRFYTQSISLCFVTSIVLIFANTTSNVLSVVICKASPASIFQYFTSAGSSSEINDAAIYPRSQSNEFVFTVVAGSEDIVFIGCEWSATRGSHQRLPGRRLLNHRHCTPFWRRAVPLPLLLGWSICPNVAHAAHHFPLLHHSIVRENDRMIVRMIVRMNISCFNPTSTPHISGARTSTVTLSWRATRPASRAVGRHLLPEILRHMRFVKHPCTKRLAQAGQPCLNRHGG